MDYIRVLGQWLWVVVSIILLAIVGQFFGVAWELAFIGGILLYRTKKEED
ncbi:MAG: hypothetical protein ACYCYO_01975 [Bacilli bacterium]